MEMVRHQAVRVKAPLVFACDRREQAQEGLVVAVVPEEKVT
jgi:hypothetical protein